VSETSATLRRPFEAAIRGYHNRLRHAANMVLGMSVDEACDQLEYHPLRGAAELKETILEAKERAIHEEGFEFGNHSNNNSNDKDDNNINYLCEAN